MNFPVPTQQNGAASAAGAQAAGAASGAVTGAVGQPLGQVPEQALLDLRNAVAGVEALQKSGAGRLQYLAQKLSAGSITAEERVEMAALMNPLSPNSAAVEQLAKSQADARRHIDAAPYLVALHDNMTGGMQEVLEQLAKSQAETREAVTVMARMMIVLGQNQLALAQGSRATGEHVEALNKSLAVNGRVPAYAPTQVNTGAQPVPRSWGAPGQGAQPANGQGQPGQGTAVLPPQGQPANGAAVTLPTLPNGGIPAGMAPGSQNLASMQAAQNLTAAMGAQAVDLESMALSDLLMKSQRGEISASPFGTQEDFASAIQRRELTGEPLSPHMQMAVEAWKKTNGLA